MGGTAEHAAVNENVELIKQARPHAAGLVNAVLRRGAREGPAILARLDDESPESAAVFHSVPGWLASKWWDELGADEARALLRVVNDPAENVLRVNSLSGYDVPDVAAALPVPSRPAPDLPEGLVLDGPFDVQGSELWASGAGPAPVARLRCSSRGSSRRAPATGCSICAPPRAARPRTWPR